MASVDFRPPSGRGPVRTDLASSSPMQESSSTLVVEPKGGPPTESATHHVRVPGDPRPAWGPSQRILFRFAFSYLVLYIFPFPLNAIPFAEDVVKPYDSLWSAVVTWVGTHLFHRTITVLPNGSGDTTFNYVQIFCYLTIAALVAAAWTIIDRRRFNYPALFRGLRIYVRYRLATTMITYGTIKVIKSQFPNPSLDRLIQPFGDASPMGLLWTFMGASESYNLFTGAGELIGGLLLTTRRTTLLGALISFGVMSHVAMLNFSYDVPVKLFSIHLVLMALFLIAPDLRRIAKMFLMNRPVEPIEIRPLEGPPWLDRTVVGARSLVVAAYTGLALWGAYDMRKTYGDLLPRSPLYGIWVVDDFEVDGKIKPPLATDADRWRRVVFDHPKMIAIQLMSDKRKRYSLKLDVDARTMELTKRDDTAWKANLTYQQPGPGLIAIEGTMEGQKIRAKLRRTDIADFLLINRGFHWINEYPFNR
jgi:hypothetical protein